MIDIDELRNMDPVDGIDLDEIADEIEKRDEYISQLESENQDMQAELDEYYDKYEGYDSVREAADTLLHVYTGVNPSLGEVMALSEDIANLLVSKYGISAGRIGG